MTSHLHPVLSGWIRLSTYIAWTRSVIEARSQVTVGRLSSGRKSPAPRSPVNYYGSRGGRKHVPRRRDSIPARNIADLTTVLRRHPYHLCTPPASSLAHFIPKKHSWFLGTTCHVVFPSPATKYDSNILLQLCWNLSTLKGVCLQGLSIHHTRRLFPHYSLFCSTVTHCIKLP